MIHGFDEPARTDSLTEARRAARSQLARVTAKRLAFRRRNTPISPAEEAKLIGLTLRGEFINHELISRIREIRRELREGKK